MLLQSRFSDWCITDKALKIKKIRQKNVFSQPIAYIIEILKYHPIIEGTYSLSDAKLPYLRDRKIFHSKQTNRIP